MKAMAVAVSNCTQWFWEQLWRSLSIRTVMPAEAHAAANIRVDVICKEKDKSSFSHHITNKIFFWWICSQSLSSVGVKCKRNL